MAVSPYKNHQSPLNRSRSSSCSSPIRNRIVYQEVYSVGENTLVRSYSCDQVFNKDESGRTFQTTHIQVSSFITPEKKKYDSNFGGSKKTQTDLKALESSTPSTIRDKVNAKKSLKMSEKTSEKKKGCVAGFLRQTFKFGLLPALTAFIFYWYINNVKEYSCVWDVKRTVSELKENVFGQNDALNRIASVLHQSSSSSDVYTLVFTGGVGVGKTYSSSIISHNFPWSCNKLITFSDSFQNDVENMFKTEFLNCGCNLVIVDDLSKDNTKDAIHLITSVRDKLKPNESLLIILVFQIHSEDERNMILKELKKAYIGFSHVPFKNLTEDDVEKCYLAEIKRQEVNISVAQLKKLIKDKMNYIDIVRGSVGCKGVAEEVAVYS